MVRVVPVTEARQVAVGPAFPVVLRGGLAVHLQQPGSRAAQHATQQMEVVDLAGRRRGLVGLVEPLQHRGKNAFRGPEDAGGLADVVGADPAHCGGRLGGPFLHRGLQVLEARGVLFDVGRVVPIVMEYFADESVHQREVGSRPDREVYLCVACDVRIPGVYTHQFGRVGP